MDGYLLSLDQGTTSSRTVVFDVEGQPVSMAQQEFPQLYPKPGWVEHDPMAIWTSQLSTAQEALAKAGIEASQIIAIGIANQRETALIWERDSGKPLYNAIVWQCRRTTDICQRWREAGFSEQMCTKTGLVLDPYFSASKIVWLLENIPGLSRRARNGEVCFGTVDSWLLYKLTGAYATDPSNASRTLLYNIHENRWDDDILRELDIPAAMLPRVYPSSARFGSTKPGLFGGEIAVSGVAGDQQAALFGQACFEPGMTKITYGTGCFALTHTGRQPQKSKNNLLSTIAWDTGTGPEYALEGSVFIGGAVIQWLRDEMGILKNAPQSEEAANSVDDNGGVFIVPAFTGLGAPYWDPDVRGAIFGMTRGATANHVVRAALESIAYQCSDLMEALEADTGLEPALLKADGGAAANAFLMQFQADIVDAPVVVPQVNETTALGAAYLAGLGSGVWKNHKEIGRTWKAGRRFDPQMSISCREELLRGWRKAVHAARQFS